MRSTLAGPLAALLLLPAPVSAARIAISTDIRLELAAAAQLLAPESSRPEGFVAPDIPYARALEAALARFKDHPAVRMHAEPKMRAFGFSDRGQVLLRLSPPPELSERLTVQYALADRAGGAENLRRWLRALGDLSNAARFPAIFAEESKKLEAATARFRAEERKQDFLGTLESYAGLPLLGTYAVHLSPFAATGGVANVVAEREDGTMEIASVIGPEPTRNGVEFWSRRVPGTLWHEAAHGVLDGLGDLYAERIDRGSALHARIGWSCYGTWNQCVKEHVVRAVMLRLMARELSEEAMEEQLRFEKEEHYPYMRALLKSLQTYEDERARYPTLADFYPRLLEVFPAQASPEPSRAPSLSAGQRRRAQRLAQAVSERAREPEALALAARFARPAEPSPVPPPSAAAPAAGAGRAGPPVEGIEAFRAGRLEEALKSFDEALKSSPQDIGTWMSRGVVLQALTRRPEALSSYDRAVSLAEADPGTLSREVLPDALSSRASLLLELGLRDRARADLSRALSVCSDDWPQRAAARARLEELTADTP